MGIYVVFYSYEYEHYASQSTASRGVIEGVFKFKHEVEQWAEEQKLSLKWYNSNKSQGRAGKYNIELHHLNELLKEKK